MPRSQKTSESTEVRVKGFKKRS